MYASQAVEPIGDESEKPSAAAVANEGSAKAQKKKDKKAAKKAKQHMRFDGEPAAQGAWASHL